MSWKDSYANMAVEKVSNSFHFSFHFNSVNSISDLHENLGSFAYDLVRPFTWEARRRRRARTHQEKEYKFFQSRPALLIYADCWLALLLHRPWILYGAALVILSQIAWIVFIWILYTIDDNRELQQSIKFLKMWLQVFVREGRSILSGKDAIKFVVASTMLQKCPTGFSYFKMVVRYRMHEMNQNAIKLENERFSRASRVKAKAGEAINDLQARMSERKQKRLDHLKRKAIDGSSNMESMEENGFETGDVIPEDVPLNK